MVIENTGILRYRQSAINFPLASAIANGIMLIRWVRGRNSVVECRLPKLEKPKTASICPSNTYVKPHFQAKTELDSNNTVALQPVVRTQ
jgi:hypothetical protein